MSSKRRNTEGLLARVNFPLYTLQMLTNRHVLVAGGGGFAKTGVANGFEIFELKFDGERYTAEEAIRHETGPKVVMNSACYSDGKHTYLAAGQEEHCQLYKVHITVEDDLEAKETKQAVNGLSDDSNLRHRVKDKRNSKVTDLNSNSCKKIKFKLIAADSIQTDFSETEPVQRVVRISRCGKLMASGGTDGHVRIWAFPSLKLIQDISAHSKELDDIDFSPNSKSVVSVSKDGLGFVWNVATGKKQHELKWAEQNGKKILFKRCRFARVEEDATKSRIFTISNSTGTSSKGAIGVISLWEGETGALKKSTIIKESLSALSVRDDGRFLAVGTMFTGSVLIYVAFSLQCALNVPGAHSMFVTGLELIPSEGSALSPNSEAAAISISIDNKICIHSLPYRRTLPPWLAIILIVITLFFAFAFCSYLGL